MKRFTKSSIALAVLLSLPVASIYAATPLSAKESRNLMPMKEISVTGRYMQASNAEKAISKAADEAGAKYYHIKGMEGATGGDSDNHNIVYADIYQANAPAAVKKDETTYNGVVAYERYKALYYLPFEVVKFKGSYNNSSDITEAASKIAASNNAYAFYVYSITSDGAQNQSQDVNVALYKKDAVVRDYIVKNVPEDEAYEISSDAFKIMKPYDTITFHGQFNNVSDITADACKHAVAAGAHFYYVKEVSSNPSGTIQTVYVNLYK